MFLVLLYSYLNLESTKTGIISYLWTSKLYSYLNLESTKTNVDDLIEDMMVVQLLKSWEYKNGDKIDKIFKTVVQLLKSWEYKNLRM